MSVPKSRRGLSPAEYVHQAAEADKLLGQLAIKLPRRWERTRTARLLDGSDRMLSEAVRANAIYVTCRPESEARLAHLTEARAECAVLQGRLERIASEMPFTRYDQALPSGEVVQVERPCVSEGYMSLVALAVDRELGLLRGAIKYERERWRGYGPGGAAPGGAPARAPEGVQSDASAHA